MSRGRGQDLGEDDTMFLFSGAETAPRRVVAKLAKLASEGFSRSDNVSEGQKTYLSCTRDHERVHISVRRGAADICYGFCGAVTPYTESYFSNGAWL